MKLLKYSLISVGLFVGMLFLTVASLFIFTQGEYTVPDTVATDPTLPHVEIDGITFHAQTFGNPQDPVVVVVHGGPGGDFGYLLNLHQLEDEYFVVFYDQRGAGLSSRVEASELSLELSIADLHRIVTHYGNEQPVRLIGHSWGAMLAAGYLGKHPDQVSQAVLAEPGALDNARLDRFRQRQATTQDLAYYWMLVPAIFESFHLDGPDADAPMDYIFGKMSANFVNTAASGYRCEDNPMKPMIASDITIPPSRFGATAFNTLFGPEADLTPIAANADNFQGDVLFLASECSSFIGVDFQREQMALFPQAELAIIPDAGHEMFGENPTDSLTVVRNFFGQ